MLYDSIYVNDNSQKDKTIVIKESSVVAGVGSWERDKEHKVLWGDGTAL